MHEHTHGGVQGSSPYSNTLTFLQPVNEYSFTRSGCIKAVRNLMSGLIRACHQMGLENPLGFGI